MRTTVDILTEKEKTAYCYFYVLDKIHTLDSAKGENQEITYYLYLYPPKISIYEPNSIEEQMIINDLILSGAIKELSERGTVQVGRSDDTKNPPTSGLSYHLAVINPRFRKIYNQNKKIVTGLATGNVMTIYSTGEVSYLSRSGIEYMTRIKVGTSQYILLKILTSEPRRNFETSELSKKIDKTNPKTFFLDDSQKVRDTIQAIEHKLKYTEGSLFKSDNGFSILCNVNLR